MFDSTHFAHGTNLLVKVEVYDTDGVLTSKTMTVPVINRSSLFARYDFEVDSLIWNASSGYYNSPTNYFSISVAQPHLSASNIFTQSHNHSQGWVAATYLQSIELATVTLLSSHGDPGGTYSDSNDTWYYYPTSPPYDHPSYYAEWITGTTDNPATHEWAIKPHRIAANGTGLPPFNTGQPPITLAYVMSCNTGATNDHAEGFLFPYTNWYVAPYYQNPPGQGGGPLIENQAQVGFNDYISLSYFEAIAEYSFAKLQQGYSVRRTMDLTYYAVYSGVPGGPSNPQDFAAVYGDHATRVHGVYTGINDFKSVIAWVGDEPHPPTGG